MLELVKTSAGTMLMGADESKAREVIAEFNKLYPSVSESIRKNPLNLSAKSKKGALVALVERTPHGANELLTPTKARIYNSGKAINQAIAAGSSDPRAVQAIAGAAATWINLATNYKTFLASQPLLLVTAAKALVQEAKIALHASGA